MPRAVAALISERSVLSVVGLNALVLFFDAFPPVHHASGHWLHWVDYACVVYFVAEVVLKLVYFGPRVYFGTGWNVFDFSIVAASFPVLLVPFGVAAGEGFGAFLILRLIRLSRFLRMLRFIPRLERLIAGAQRALRASLGVLLATMFYLFVFGLAATYLFGQEGSPVYEKFKDPLISMYSMFTVFTVEGWFETPDLIAQHSGYWAGHGVRAFFVLAVIMGGIILLSLLNAVFVEEMSSDLSEQQESSFDALERDLQSLRAELVEKLATIEAKLGGG